MAKQKLEFSQELRCCGLNCVPEKEVLNLKVMTGVLIRRWEFGPNRDRRRAREDGDSSGTEESASHGRPRTQHH